MATLKSCCGICSLFPGSESCPPVCDDLALLVLRGRPGVPSAWHDELFHDRYVTSSLKTSSAVL